MKPLRLLLFFLCVVPVLAKGQTITSFDGISASQLASPKLDIDPNGAVGTKQYLEWVNVSFQAYDKVTFAPVWAVPQVGILPWQRNNMPNCTTIGGDGLVLFDRLASRWIIAGHSPAIQGKYYYCVAVSTTDDLSSSTLGWNTYQFQLTPFLATNSLGHVYFPDWPKLATWSDAYYVSFDLEDPDNNFREIGVVACALDRSNMLRGANARDLQCFSDPVPIPSIGSLYFAHSLIPADVEGTMAPPSGRDEFLVSIQNPPNDGFTLTSDSINLWDFHVDWATPANSTFSRQQMSVPPYTPGCYNVQRPTWTICVPEPTVNSSGNHYHIDAVGDRFMPRLAYRNFGTYESFLFSQTVQVSASSKQTGIQWYELRGSVFPSLFQSGLIAPDKALYRFIPSIAQDNVGNAALGFSVSNLITHPGIKTSYWNLRNGTTPTELWIQHGGGDEQNAPNYGDYNSMTVDPVDGCTFWYVNEYFPTNQTGSTRVWNTRIAKYKISTCD